MLSTRKPRFDPLKLLDDPKNRVCYCLCPEALSCTSLDSPLRLEVIESNAKTIPTKSRFVVLAMHGANEHPLYRSGSRSHEGSR
jgi:hypothetical protein